MYKNLQDKLLEKALIIRNKSQNSKCFSYPVITTCAIKKVIDENVGKFDPSEANDLLDRQS